MRESPEHTVVLSLGDTRIALRLAVVQRVVRAAAVVPVANAPAELLGLLDVHGAIVPLFDIRGVFGIPRREVTARDQFVIASACARTVAILADEVLGVSELKADGVTAPTDILPGLAGVIEGVVKLEDGIVLIYDLEKFLCRNGSFLLDEVVAAQDGNRMLV